MKRLFMLLLMIFSITTAYTQNITKAEYFFDTDPGQGNGSVITILSPADTVNFSTNIPLNGLSNGFHILLLRVRNANGTWSNSESRYFYILSNTTTNTTDITAAEYFFDTDPGVGNGTPTTVGTTGPVVNFTVMTPANLSPGFHFLAIRTRDADGKWGFSETRNFYLAPPPAADMPPIIAAEYFYDHDPGVGNGAVLNISSPGNIITQTFMVPVPDTMSASNHFLTIRVKDQAGHWSLFEKDTLTVGAAQASITCPGNITVNASAGQCSVVVNNIDPIVTPQGSSYTYTLTGATTGSGTGTVSGHMFNAGTTTVTYALTNSPLTNCSFTVTVNANVVPSVNINASATSICTGTQVTFTPTPTNGGNPTYVWKRNGSVVSTNSTFVTSILSDQDEIKAEMTSSLGCANPQTVTSNIITMSVGTTVTPTVSISTASTSICTGTQITFNATSTNGGNPTYTWKRNGAVVGTGTTWQTSNLSDQDQIKAEMTSSLGCASPQTITSNIITMTVGTTVTPTVSINATATSICSGTQVTFTATSTNGGDPSYVWKRNGTVVSLISTFVTSILSDQDEIKAEMTSSLGCANPQTVTSNIITMSVGTTVTPTISISTAATSICTGTQVTFNATSINGGTPAYTWKRNGTIVGTDTSWQTSNLSDQDQIKAEMTSSLGCASPQTVTSNIITMTVGTTVTPSVNIIASTNPICPGTLVTFTATPINGGINPYYQWRVNGNSVSTAGPSYQSSSLQNGDSVEVFLTSTLPCADPYLALSNSIHITVAQPVTPSVSIEASATSICSGQQVNFTATPVNGGSNPSYQWKKNGINVGTNSNIYQTTSLANNDVISVIMIPSVCSNLSSATSNNITMTVGSVVTPSVSIAASARDICAGTQVMFTATPTNGGNPTYQWKLNGNSIPAANNATYQSTTLVNNDVISVSMISSLSCASPSTIASNNITMSVTSLLIFYADFDHDGYGNGASGVVEACSAPAGYVANNGDCDDFNAAVHPGVTEICGNNIDDNCNGQIDEACGSSPDNDNDGYTIAQGDCNDNNPAVNPGHAEVCGNGIDDNCNGVIDENCNSNIPVVNLRVYPVKEGDVGQTILNMEVTLDIPATLPVSINYATSNDDAIAGLDYVATNGILNIPVGSTSGTIQLRIIGDLLRESNERFWVNFSNPVNVVLGSDPRSRIMIIDDDKGKGNNTITAIDKVSGENELMKIPSVTKCNQVWTIPQIGNYENEILIMNTQGQLINRFINYRNQTALTNVTIGLYFYRIQVKERNGQSKYYTGRLMITE